MNNIPIAYCGIDCNKCPVYLYATKGDTNAILNFARKLVDSFGGDIEEYKTYKCLGCVPDVNVKAPHPTVCNIRKCAREKKYNTCAECNAYENCSLLQDHFKIALQPSKVNLDKLRKS